MSTKKLKPKLNTTNRRAPRPKKKKPVETDEQGNPKPKEKIVKEIVDPRNDPRVNTRNPVTPGCDCDSYRHHPGLYSWLAQQPAGSCEALWTCWGSHENQMQALSAQTNKDLTTAFNHRKSNAKK